MKATTIIALSLAAATTFAHPMAVGTKFVVRQEESHHGKWHKVKAGALAAGRIAGHVAGHLSEREDGIDDLVARDANPELLPRRKRRKSATRPEAPSSCKVVETGGKPHFECTLKPKEDQVHRRHLDDPLARRAGEKETPKEKPKGDPPVHTAAPKPSQPPRRMRKRPSRRKRPAQSPAAQSPAAHGPEPTKTSKPHVVRRGGEKVTPVAVPHQHPHHEHSHEHSHHEHPQHEHPQHAHAPHVVRRGGEKVTPAAVHHPAHPPAAHGPEPTKTSEPYVVYRPKKGAARRKNAWDPPARFGRRAVEKETPKETPAAVPHQHPHHEHSHEHSQYGHTHHEHATRVVRRDREKVTPAAVPHQHPHHEHTHHEHAYEHAPRVARRAVGKETPKVTPAEVPHHHPHHEHSHHGDHDQHRHHAAPPHGEQGPEHHKTSAGPGGGKN